MSPYGRRNDLRPSRSVRSARSEGEEELSPANAPKEQMVEELMLEYLKTALGKAPLLKMEWEYPSAIP